MCPIILKQSDTHFLSPSRPPRWRDAKGPLLAAAALVLLSLVIDGVRLFLTH